MPAQPWINFSQSRILRAPKHKQCWNVCGNMVASRKPGRSGLVLRGQSIRFRSSATSVLAFMLCVAARLAGIRHVNSVTVRIRQKRAPISTCLDKGGSGICLTLRVSAPLSTTPGDNYTARGCRQLRSGQRGRLGDVLRYPEVGSD